MHDPAFYLEAGEYMESYGIVELVLFLNGFFNI
jgi:hypothetical protein